MDSKIKEKLTQIQSLISECLSEESYEDESEEMSEESESADSNSEQAGDKIKMAASMLKRRMGE